MSTNQLSEQENNFCKLAKINVNEHTEKKGRFTYLSWTFAVSEAMKIDPLTNWVFREPTVFADGTMMVHCDVTMFGKSIYMFLPVMNNQNKAIQKPNAFDVNSAMMRCLVKGIAAHGLGLYIYAGEDLPEEEKQYQQQANQNQADQQPVANQEKPIAQRYQDALKAIASAKKIDTLNKAISTFGPTQYAAAIQRACNARADQMGWSTPPVNQNQNQTSSQVRH